MVNIVCAHLIALTSSSPTDYFAFILSYFYRHVAVAAFGTLHVRHLLQNWYMRVDKLTLTLLVILDRVFFEFDHLQLSAALIFELTSDSSKYVSLRNELLSVGSLWLNNILKTLVDKMEHIAPQMSPLIVCLNACRSHLLKNSFSKETALSKVASDAADCLRKTIDALIVAFVDHIKLKKLSISVADSALLSKAVSRTDYSSLSDLLFSASATGGDGVLNTNNISPRTSSGGEFERELPFFSPPFFSNAQIFKSAKSLEPRALVEVALSCFQEVQKYDTLSQDEIYIISQELLLCFLSQKQTDSFFDSYAAFWLNPLLLELPPTHNRVLQPKTKRNLGSSSGQLQVALPRCGSILFLANPKKTLEVLIRVRRY